VSKKYRITLKYNGFPEFNIETTAASDNEAMKNAVDEVLRQQPNLKDREIVLQVITSSNDPY